MASTTFVGQCWGAQLRDRAREGVRKALALALGLTVFLAALLIDSVKRFSARPTSGRMRFIYNRDFPDALDFNRIVVRAEGRSEAIIDEWDALARKLFDKDNPADNGNENEQGESHERKKHEHRT